MWLFPVLGAAGAAAFFLPDAAAAGVALAAETAAARAAGRRVAAARQIAAFVLYRCTIAGFFAVPVKSHLAALPDIAVKAAAIGIVAGIALTSAAAARAAFRCTNSKNTCLPYAAAGIATDFALFFFFVPSFPALLAIPFGAPFLALGGVPLLVVVWHAAIFATQCLFLDSPRPTPSLLPKIAPTAILGALFAAAMSAAAPGNAETVKISVLHTNLNFPAHPRQISAGLSASTDSPPNHPVVFPESFLPTSPFNISAAFAQTKTRELIVGARVGFAGEIYAGAAFQIQRGKIGAAHFKTVLFPGEFLAGAKKSPFPAQIFVAGGARIQPLICFEVVKPLRSPAPAGAAANAYAVLSNTEDFPQPSRRTVRLLAQALAAQKNRPVALASNFGESAVIAAGGKLIAFADDRGAAVKLLPPPQKVSKL